MSRKQFFFIGSLIFMASVFLFGQQSLQIAVNDFLVESEKVEYEFLGKGFTEFIGIDPSNFFFVAVEKEFPFKNQIFGLSQQTVEIARKNLYSTIEKIKNKDYGVKNFEPIERV